ncbi:MAG: hypothetical protein ACETWG_11450, partial [Candidatus Neomarinimicrobiota bacterium]
MKRLSLTLVSCLMLFWASTCRNGTGPDDDDDDDVIRDPREYTWTVDTLAFGPQTAMTAIWGSSPTDVYAVGHNALYTGKMFHYNGEKWRNVDYTTFVGGVADDLRDVLGFAEDDVWAVGVHSYRNPDPPPNFIDSAMVLHYDGTGWREVKTPSVPGLMAIGGSGPQDIWAGGLYGTLLHYDGNAWTPDSIP